MTACTLCGGRKGPVPCRRCADTGIEPAWKIGDVGPLPREKLDIRPNAPIDNRSSFKPARKPSRF